MKNIAIVNGISLSGFSARPLVDGKNALECVLEAVRGMPDVEKVVVLLSSPREEAKGCDILQEASWSAMKVLEQMAKSGKDFDNIFYCFGDTPLIDPSLAGRMYGNHVKYFAKYTFAYGFPSGLSVEIVKPHILDSLKKLCREKDVISRDMLFELVKRDINSFDLETELSPVDLRILRLSLSADTKSNFLILRNIIEAGGKDLDNVLDLVQKKPQLLRALPAYYQVQIVEGCPQACSYCPYPVILPNVIGKKNEMPQDRVAELAEKALDFSGECAMSISLWGEPALHSDIYGIIVRLLSMEGLSPVIETSGIGWDHASLRAMAGRVKKHPLWIVSLDSYEPVLYKKLRGDGFDQAVATARLLLELFPGRVYMQAVRMNENEEQLERFYREWKKETENVIVQKYDAFSGFLPDRKVTDLSPLNRFPCWHNKREIAVLIDGSVPLCREDLKKQHRLGNAFTDPMEKIWKEGEAVYHRHVSGDYPDLCKGCDEYYTFNF